VATFEVYSLQWDDGNESHLDEHGVYADDVEDLFFDDDPEGRIRWVGTNRSGRMLVVIMERTPTYGEWRPVTGWWASERDHEAALYRNRKEKRRR
jgi:hypothetical protein